MLCKQLNWAYPDVVKATGYSHPVSDLELTCLLFFETAEYLISKES
jgi:hypothetical protein